MIGYWFSIISWVVASAGVSLGRLDLLEPFSSRIFFVKSFSSGINSFPDYSLINHLWFTSISYFSQTQHSSIKRVAACFFERTWHVFYSTFTLLHITFWMLSGEHEDSL